MKEIAPYGTWTSPITAPEVASAESRFSFPFFAGDEVLWQEGRPDEGGRTVIMAAGPSGAEASGSARNVLPRPWNARNRVHEYGGRSFLPVPAADPVSAADGGGFDLVFANLADQRLYRIGVGSGATESGMAQSGMAGAQTAPPIPDISVMRGDGDGGGDGRAVASETNGAVALTPEGAGFRFADMTLSPDKSEIWCVREAHSGGGTSRDGASGGGHEAGSEITRAIVAVPLDGSAADDPGKIRVMVTGADFFAFPTPSPDGTRIAWINWDHPRMPWDGTELRTGPSSGSTASGSTASGSTASGITVGESMLLMGGPGESVQAPAWRDDSELYAISDRSGWWNLYRVPESGGEPKPLCPREEEFAGPLWQLGAHPYAVLGDGRLAVTHGTGEQRLSILDPESGELTDTGLPYQAYGTIAASGMAVATVAGGSRTPLRVILLDAARAGGAGAGGARAGDASADAPVVLREARLTVDPAYLPVARQVALPAGPEGSAVHALVYPPSSPACDAPEGELPPYIVWVHGGPTSKSMPLLDVEKAYFTSRGIGVIDVNYGGSTGYGRAYRERLRGQWGVVDVADAMNAALALAEAGEADGRRLGIRGGSAGGWTALAAVTSGLTGASDDGGAGHPPVFAAAVSYYGVAELKSFVDSTHDFESRYLDGLIGPLPSASALYDERSPLGHVTPLTCPILLLQGLEDPIVPPSQSEAIAADLAAHGIRYAYIAFEDESHGFRKAETIVRSLEAELAFYGQIMGFTPPGVSPVTLREPRAD